MQNYRLSVGNHVLVKAARHLSSDFCEPGSRAISRNLSPPPIVDKVSQSVFFSIV